MGIMTKFMFAKVAKTEYFKATRMMKAINR